MPSMPVYNNAYYILLYVYLTYSYAQLIYFRYTLLQTFNQIIYNSLELSVFDRQLSTSYG